MLQKIQGTFIGNAEYVFPILRGKPEVASTDVLAELFTAFQLTLSDQSLKLKDSKRLPPHPFDILTFLSSKWLAIVYLHWTDEA